MPTKKYIYYSMILWYNDINDIQKSEVPRLWLKRNT